MFPVAPRETLCESLRSLRLCVRSLVHDPILHAPFRHNPILRSTFPAFPAEVDCKDPPFIYRGCRVKPDSRRVETRCMRHMEIGDRALCC